MCGNDLRDCLENTVYKFADDSKLFQIARDATNFGSMNNDLEKLDSWSEKWLLQFNPDKCKQMTISKIPNFTSERRALMDPIQSLPIQIAPTSNEKDLGVVIDDKMTFKGYIGGIIKKANKLMGLIRRTFINLEKEVFVPLYIASEESS